MLCDVSIFFLINNLVIDLVMCLVIEDKVRDIRWIFFLIFEDLD